MSSAAATHKATVLLQARLRGMMVRDGRTLPIGGSGSGDAGATAPWDPTAASWDVHGVVKELDDAAFEAAFGVTRGAFLTMRGWRQRMLAAKVAKPPDFAWSFPHRDATPFTAAQILDASPDGRVQWSTLEGFTHSEDGSCGVMFVLFPGQRALCIKCAPSAAAEVFGTRLALHLNLRAPAVRPVLAKSVEGKEMRAALCAFDDKRPVGDRSAAQDMRHRKTFLVYEYVKGTSLEDIDHLHADCPAWVARVLGPAKAPHAKGQQWLSELGRTVCFDMLTNNWDRLPVVWDNAGNPGNLMNGIGDDVVWSIDNMIATLDTRHADRGALDALFHAVKLNVHHVSESPDVPWLDFAKIRALLLKGADSHGTMLWAGLGHDIGDAGVCCIQRGFLAAIRHAVGSLGSGELEAWVAELQSFFYSAEDAAAFASGDKVPMDGFELIHTDFIAQICSFFQTCDRRADLLTRGEACAPLGKDHFSRRGRVTISAVPLPIPSSSDDLRLDVRTHAAVLVGGTRFVNGTSSASGAAMLQLAKDLHSVKDSIHFLRASALHARHHHCHRPKEQQGGGDAAAAAAAALPPLPPPPVDGGGEHAAEVGEEAKKEDVAAGADVHPPPRLQQPRPPLTRRTGSARALASAAFLSDRAGAAAAAAAGSTSDRGGSKAGGKNFGRSSSSSSRRHVAVVSLEDLRAHVNLPPDFDATHKAMYLSDADFAMAYGGVSRDWYYALPIFRQIELNAKARLF